MQRVCRRGSQVLCCKVGYSATLARGQGHNFKGYLHWGKVLAVDGSECTIKWQTDKKPSSHSITDVFLTAFHSIPSSDSAYPESDHEATDPKISLRTAAQENTQTQSDPPRFCLLIFSAIQRATHVPVMRTSMPTLLQSHHRDQSQLFPFLCHPGNVICTVLRAHPSARGGLARCKGSINSIWCTVLKVLQCLTAIVIIVRTLHPTYPFLHYRGVGGIWSQVKLAWEIWSFNLAAKFITRNPGVKSKSCFWECPPNLPCEIQGLLPNFPQPN